MNIAQIKEAINNGSFDKDFSLLYQDVENARARYIKACDEFKSIFGDRDNIHLYSAPGRTEVGGNHTDHQHGRVLAGSVDLDIIGVVEPTVEAAIKATKNGKIGIIGTEGTIKSGSYKNKILVHPVNIQYIGLWYLPHTAPFHHSHRFHLNLVSAALKSFSWWLFYPLHSVQ